MHIGIDIEQFVRDPYGSGIQRVLQYLAIEWPHEIARADFVIPLEGGHGLLTSQQAAELLTVPFEPRDPGTDLRQLVNSTIERLAPTRVRPGDLLAIYDAWLLPEVSYLPSVLERFGLFARCVPTAMIGYDTLPMSEPANYRFKPGSSAWVSEYFRLLATADAVACISDYARDSILGRLRRDTALDICVAHPGGDHLPVLAPRPPDHPVFTRLGTLEARKRPVEIAAAFREACSGTDAELLFIGGASASDEAINSAIRGHVDAGSVRWVQGASDDDVRSLVRDSSVFLSIGVEGYGIPVLEAIRLGTPVVFDGIQPAGDLMVGCGAGRMPAMTHAELVATFRALAAGGADKIRAELAPEAVPTWRQFAERVALAVAQA